MTILEILVFLWLLLIVILPVLSHLMQLKNKELSKNAIIIDRAFIFCAILMLVAYIISLR